jgi:hypothetical protein
MNVPATSVTSEDVERTGRIVAFALWGIASIVMVGSMVSGGHAFHDLGEPAAFGVLTAFAADVALTSWLLISRRLRALGTSSVMGVVLELACGGASVFLNVGAAVFPGLSAAAAKTMLAIAHSFLPILLVLVSLTGGEAHLRLVRLRREREVAEQAQRDAEQRQREDMQRRRANGELVDAQAVLDKAHELRRLAEQETRRLRDAQQQAQRVRAEIEAEVTATQAVRDKLATPQPTRPRSRTRRSAAKNKASVEDRKQWVRDFFATTGTLPPGPRVDEEFGTTRCGYKIVNAVQAEITEEKRRALHVVTGGPR